MGKAIEVTRRDHTPSELRKLAAKTADGGKVRRLLGVALVLEGRPRGEAAAASGIDRQILCDWVHRYNAAGIAGLATGLRPGRPPALNEAQMAELKELVVKGPDPARHRVARWRCVDLSRR
jgi:transposase